MKPEEFAQAVRDERDTLLSSFANPSGGTAVGAHLLAANLSSSQQEEVLAAIDAALTDAFYTLLLALDGSASLGGAQQSFLVSDENGGVIANGDGRLEAAAWNVFHENSS